MFEPVTTSRSPAARLRIERLTEDTDVQKLSATLKSDPKSIAVVRESEYATLLIADPGLKIVAQAETFGHGGLSLNMIRNPRRDGLLLIGQGSLVEGLMRRARIRTIGQAIISYRESPVRGERSTKSHEAEIIFVRLRVTLWIFLSAPREALKPPEANRLTLFGNNSHAKSS